MKKNRKEIRLLKALAFPVSAWFMFTIGTTAIHAQETDASNVESMPQTMELTTSGIDSTETNQNAVNDNESSNGNEDQKTMDDYWEWANQNVSTSNVDSSKQEKTDSVTYETHVQDIGWQKPKEDGEVAGTTGQSKRIEAIDIKLNSQYEGNVVYQAHVQDIGWQDQVENGAIAGTSGQSKRVEALRVWLTGDIANHYSIQYRVHVSNLGWLDWVSDGMLAGTTGRGLKIEGIQIRLTDFTNKELLQYTTHVQDIGWQNQVTSGQLAGTTGQSKRVEGIRVYYNDAQYGGSIQYQAHVQDIGWQTVVSNGELAGTSGQSKRVEAIRFMLDGEVSQYYDIYYRVHVSDYGWLDWARNGAIAGTSGLSKKIEAIEIKLLEKGTQIINTGVTSIEGGKAYVNGKVADGWQEINGSTYYVDSGKINKSTGWKEVDGEYYYFSSGVKQANTWIGNSYVDSDGKRLTGWQEIGENKYYFNEDGQRQTGYQTIDGNKYYFHSNGAMAVNEWKGCDYADENGIVTTKHNWVAQTKVVHHAEVGHNEQVLVQAGYDEQKPIYTQQERSICNVCGADITGNYYAHTEAHLLAGEGGGYHSELVQTLIGYETIHHDAQYTTQYVVDTPAYDETVTTGYKCSCGATK